jgi:GntR family transcriptional regulator / MocR family aminotransferase
MGRYFVAKGSSAAPFAVVSLDEASPVPLYRQLYDELRGAILGGRLGSGSRLPSTRDLAADLGVSRNTVSNAFLQLCAEGYLEGKVGSGTYVSRSLPDDLLLARPSARPEAPRMPPSARADSGLSRRGKLLAVTPATATVRRGRPRAFRSGVPALDAFPSETWARLAARCWRGAPQSLFGYGDPAGYRPLREAIAEYLGAVRAARCSWEQVIVVSGSQQALDLGARVLLDPGDTAWVEDPCYPAARGALVGSGARLAPVTVDSEGLDVAAGETRAVDARLAYITPSHQYPLGVTMSLARRLALLDWANRSGAWILEDDYDSEYRYSGRPLSSLQGLDDGGRVLYLGTFSKVLSPALRLGYLVVPPDLVDAFVAARALVDRHSPMMEQAVLVEFIAEGHFARHVRRMRSLYAERRDALVEALGRGLAGLIEVGAVDAGLHLVGWLPEGTDDREASRRAAALGSVWHRGISTPGIAAGLCGCQRGRDPRRGKAARRSSGVSRVALAREVLTDADRRDTKPSRPRLPRRGLVRVGRGVKPLPAHEATEAYREGERSCLHLLTYSSLHGTF